MQNSVHPGAYPSKKGLHSTPIAIGKPLSNSDSLHAFFFQKKTQQVGVVQAALLTAFALPKCLWQCSHLLLKDRQTNRQVLFGGGPFVSHVPSNSPRLYGTWLCEHQKFTAHSSYCWFYIRWRWRNVWLTQASYYLRWKRPDIVRKKHAKKYYYLLQNFRYHATKYVNIQKRVSQFLYCLTTCKCVPVNMR